MSLFAGRGSSCSTARTCAGCRLTLCPECAHTKASQPTRLSCAVRRQAGTLSGNPLAMTAGIKTLEILARPGAYDYLDRITGRLINGLLEAGRETGHAMCGGHISGEDCILVHQRSGFGGNMVHGAACHRSRASSSPDRRHDNTGPVTPEVWTPAGVAFVQDGDG